ncbi:MAG: TetR/AcrR family transcriptional regulator [Pseudomonadota bacterium]
MALSNDLEDLRKAQILNAAISTLSAKGSASVTMEEVAGAAGLSKGGLAHYYRSKNELFKAAFKEFFSRIFERSRLTMSQRDAPLDKLLSFDWLYDENDPDVNVGYPMLYDCMSMAVHDDEYRVLFHDWVENWVALLRDVISEGVSLDIFRDIEPDATARNISAIYQGIASRWYLARSAHSTEWAISSFRQAITRLLMDV